MGQTFFDKWRHRFAGAWDVLIGRAWAGYGNPIYWKYVGPPDHPPTIAELEELLR